MNPSQRSRVKQEVGEFVVNEILRYVERGESPIEGKGKFTRLNADYAKKEKGGDTTPNLELEGDMLDSLDFADGGGNSVEIGIFDPEEAAKAYGHHTGMKGHRILQGKVPKRQFVPAPNQKFKDNIRTGIESIVKQYEGRETAPQFATTLEDEQGVEIVDVLGADFLDQFLEDFFNG